MKRKLFVALAILASFLLGRSLSGCSERFGTHVDSAYWMPKGSSDGAFYTPGTAVIIGPPYFHYEFTISESDFRSYIEKMGHDVSEIDEPVHVTRYLERFVRVEDYKVGSATDYDARDAATKALIEEGLVATASGEDQSYLWAFDRGKSRAFVELNFR